MWFEEGYYFCWFVVISIVWLDMERGYWCINWLNVFYNINDDGCSSYVVLWYLVLKDVDKV